MLEEHVASFLESLKEHRYAWGMRHFSSLTATGFSLFMADRVRSPRLITRDHVRRYLAVRARLFLATRGRGMLASYRYKIEICLRHFIEHLHKNGIQTGIRFPERAKPELLPVHQSLLEAWEKFLTGDRGLAVGSVRQYKDAVWQFLFFAKERKFSRLKDLSPRFLYDFLAWEARRVGHLQNSLILVGLRSFLRYLRGEGILKLDAAAWLIQPPRYRLARVVRSVPLSELVALFRDVRGSSPPDLRDRLILTLLTAYGLRIGDIARLTFQQIRWREGTILVHQEKTGTPLTLPLHPVVAKVLLEYVREARPKGTPYREVLLTFQCPRPYPNGGTLASTLRRRIRRLGFRIHPHMFRHMVATRLINNGCPPAWIQILLGHKNPQTTAIYSKVDMAHLREVAENDGADL